MDLYHISSIIEYYVTCIHYITSTFIMEITGKFLIFNFFAWIYRRNIRIWCMMTIETDSIDINIKLHAFVCGYYCRVNKIAILAIVTDNKYLCKKTTVLDTLVTITMTSDVENSKNEIIISSHVNFLSHTSQCHQIMTL